MSSLKAYKYRLYPNKKQAEKLQWVLNRCRELYNSALQERRDAYEMMVKRHPNYYDEATRKHLTHEYALSYNQQATQLPEVKETRLEYNDIHSQVLQDVLRRMDKAFKAFFRRVKEGKAPGYPRFQGYGRYDSFTYPQSGFSLTEDNRVCLSKIGTIKVKMPTGKKANPPQGTMKTCTIKREGQHWFIVFTCEVEQDMLRSPMEAPSRTHAMCAPANTSSRNYKRRSLAKSVDQSAEEKPRNESARLTAIFVTRGKIFTTNGLVSWSRHIKSSCLKSSSLPT